MCSNALMFRCLKRTRRAYHSIGGQHILLLLIFIAYVFSGSVMFFVLENENDFLVRDEWRKQIAENRTQFVRETLMDTLFNNSNFFLWINNRKTELISVLLDEKLAAYEQQLGIVEVAKMKYEWNLINSFIYACQLITTIGHGHIYPLTEAGRIASMVYLLFGIPLMIVALSHLSRPLGVLLTYPGRMLHACWNFIRFCGHTSVESFDILTPSGLVVVQSVPKKRRNSFILRHIPIPLAIFALLAYLFGGAAVFWYFESDSRSLLDGVYFCFNLLTTVGIGDVIPTSSYVFAGFFLYVFVGLALVSLFINLIHSNLTEAYRIHQTKPITNKGYLALSPVDEIPDINNFYNTSTMPAVDANQNCTDTIYKTFAPPTTKRPSTPTVVTMGVFQMRGDQNESNSDTTGVSTILSRQKTTEEVAIPVPIEHPQMYANEPNSESSSPTVPRKDPPRVQVVRKSYANTSATAALLSKGPTRLLEVEWKGETLPHRTTTSVLRPNSSRSLDNINRLSIEAHQVTSRKYRGSQYI